MPITNLNHDVTLTSFRNKVTYYHFMSYIQKNLRCCLKLVKGYLQIDVGRKTQKPKKETLVKRTARKLRRRKRNMGTLNLRTYF